jgi:hypothetical protein
MGPENRRGDEPKAESIEWENGENRAEVGPRPYTPTRGKPLTDCNHWRIPLAVLCELRTMGALEALQGVAPAKGDGPDHLPRYAKSRGSPRE